jgi:lysophospholipase L1-like esterase
MFGFSRFALVTLLAIVAFVQGALAVTPLKEGDRVVIYGDSITQQRLYSRYLQQYIYCRYPNLRVKFYNAGWSGDRAPGALARLQRDVLSLNPTVVTLFFGMNDGGYKKLEDATVQTYRDAMEGIIKALQAKNIRVIVFTPGCVDYDRKKNLGDCEYNKTLEALGEAGRELAGKYHCDFVDVIHPMLQFQREQKATQATFTMIPDAVHPDAKGHLVMACQMLTAFAEPMPALGEADIATGATTGALHIENKSANSVTLKATTGVPFWIDPESVPTARECGMFEFACPTLTVKGLPAGTYRVLAEGVPAGDFTAAELAGGVRLLLPTTQGKQLHDLTATKENNYYSLWREVRLPLANVTNVQKAVDAMMSADDVMHATTHEIAAGGSQVTIAISPKPEGVNLALGKSYECNDPNKFNWGIGGLTNGSWEASNKGCFASGDAAAFPKTATIDLEAPQAINSIVIGVPPFGATKTIEVSTSVDGKTFTPVSSQVFEQKKEARKTFDFAPAQARYVRLTYPDHYADGNGFSPNFVFTTEVEVYGKPAK